MKMDLGIADRTPQHRRYATAAFAVALLVAITAVAISPVGYVGASSDDEQYLAAARCWVAHAWPCAPHSHWWTRWPAILPIAAYSSLFGESRVFVEAGPAMWWALALISIGWLGNAWFGWRAGAIALALFGTAPIIAVNALDPNIDIPEVALQLSALAAADFAYRRQSRGFAIVAGLLAAIAIQARETSSLFILACCLAWFALAPRSRKVLLWAVAGFVGAEFMEMLVYSVATGNPFLRLQLAMGHTDIPSNQLPTGFHSARGPILNPDYIRSWKRDMHIALWWPIDPWLNLLASRQSGMLLASCGLSAVLLRARLTITERQKVICLVSGAALISLGLVYVLAVDPKPRMFMSAYAALALAGGAVISRGLHGETKALAAALLFVPVLCGLYVMSHFKTSAPAEARARQWIARYQPNIEIFPGAASYLTLVPEARELPASGSGKPLAIATANGSCGGLTHDVRGHRIGIVMDAVHPQGYLCLIEYLPVRPKFASAD